MSKIILSRYSEWLFRLILLIAIGINLWLTKSFVTRNEFDAMNKENQIAHTLIHQAVTDISTSLKLLSANSLKLEDHELRIRNVESKQLINIIKIENIEKEIGNKYGSIK